MNDSIESIRHKAEEGNSNAQYQLGLAYSKGIDVDKKDNKLALEWLEKAACQDHLEAQLELGSLYSRLGIAYRDYEKSFKWLEQAARLHNHPDAHYQLASKYSAGQGVQQDMHKAIEHYEKAAELGHVGAMETLGNGYFHGEGVPKDLAKAHFWYEKGAQTDQSSHLQYLTAICYRDGLGSISSTEKTVYWLEKSAKSGNKNALYYLGYLFVFGSLVKQDSNKGIPLLKKAAEKGHAEAAELLGKLFFDNNMLAEAHEYLSKALSMGKGEVRELLNDPRIIEAEKKHRELEKDSYIAVARILSNGCQELERELSAYFDDSATFNDVFVNDLDFDIEKAIDALTYSLAKHNRILMIDHKYEPDQALRSMNELVDHQLSKNNGQFKTLLSSYESSNLGVSNFIGNEEDTRIFELVNSCGFALVTIGNGADFLNLVLIEINRLDDLLKFAKQARIALNFVNFNDTKKRRGISSFFNKISLFKS